METEKADKEKRNFFMNTWDYSRDYKIGELVAVRNELRYITRVKGGQQSSDRETSQQVINGRSHKSIVQEELTNKQNKNEENQGKK